MDRDFVYICSPIFKYRYIGPTLLCVGHAPLVRDWDYCAAQRFGGEFWDVEWDTRTCLAGVISRSDTARVGCTSRVNYRNCNNIIIPECDAWTVYKLGKWIRRCFPCMAETWGHSVVCDAMTPLTWLRDCYQGCLLALRINDARSHTHRVRLCTRSGAVPDIHIDNI